MSSERGVSLEYNVVGLLFPLILFILSFLGGQYFASIGEYGYALALYVLSFSSLLAFFVVMARWWGFKEAKRRYEAAEREERRRRFMEEYSEDVDE